MEKMLRLVLSPRSNVLKGLKPFIVATICILSCVGASAQVITENTFEEAGWNTNAANTTTSSRSTTLANSTTFTSLTSIVPAIGTNTATSAGTTSRFYYSYTWYTGTNVFSSSTVTNSYSSTNATGGTASGTYTKTWLASAAALISNNIVSSNGYIRTGAKSMQLSGSGRGFIITPVLPGVATVSFYVSASQVSSSNTVQVAVNTNTSITASTATLTRTLGTGSASASVSSWSGSNYSSNATFLNNASSWYQVSFTTNIAGNTPVYLKIQNASNSAGVDLYIDDIQITQPLPPVTYDLYRPVATGSLASPLDWNTASNWEGSNDAGANWTTSINVPSGAGTVNIPSGYFVAIDAATSTPVTNVSGYLRNTSTITPSGTLTVNSTGIFDSRATTTIPAITWQTGSTLKITGTFSGAAGAASGTLTAGTYKNIVFDCSITNTDSYISTSGVTASEKFTVQATGNGAVLGSTGTSLTCGSYEQNGGIFYVNRQAGGTRTLNVTGNMDVNAGTLYAKINPASNNNTSLGEINVGGNLTVATGAVISNGAIGGFTPSTLAPVITFNGTGTQVFTVNGTLDGLLDITLNKASGSVNLGSNISVTGALTVTAGSLDLGNNNIVLVSDATNTGRVAATTVLIPFTYGTGRFVLQRYIPGGRRAFRFLGHPFTGSLTMASLIDNIYVTGAGAGFDATATNNPSASWFDPTATAPGAWAAFASTSDASWTQFRGIRALVRGDRSQPTALTGGNPTPNAVTLDMSGIINTGSVNIPLTTGNSYHLVSNPYPAPTNIGAVIDATANIGTQYWLWDANALTRGAYVTKTVGDGAYNLGMNGAFVVLPTASTSLVFAETNKTASATAGLFRTNSSKQKQLELELQYNNYYADNMFVRFNKDAQTAFEQNDGSKLINQDANLYVLSADGKKLSLDARPFDVDAAIPMGFTTTITGAYKIKVVDNGLELGMEVYLKDKFLNTITKLDKDAEYAFTVTSEAATQGESRFELVMKQAPVFVPLVTSFSIKLSPNPATDMVKVAFSNEEKAATSISIVNAQGKIVSTVNAGDVQSGTVDINVKGLAKGSYFVTLSNGKEKKTEKLQIQ